MVTHCLIWNEELPSPGHFNGDILVTTVYDSPRAGGGYVVEDGGIPVEGLSDEEKARLTTTLIDLRVHNPTPKITRELLDDAKRRPPLSASQRADRLLRCLVDMTHKIGGSVGIEDKIPLMAWSESTTPTEVDFLLGYLEQQGLTEVERVVNGSRMATVTISGYAVLGRQQTTADPAMGFVAMWFSDETKDAYRNGIAPAIRAAGYDPKRIDEMFAQGDTELDKVDDAIIAEIRKSRFVVADFTGLRGGVYYEAGFASGLEIPVFHTCRKDQIDKLHFDIRQIYHIPWETPEELYKELYDRIRSRLGEGPLA